MKKKALSILLVILMCITMLPTAAFAADEGGIQQIACSCEEKCTAEQMNSDCSVCSAEGALPENCCASENVVESIENDVNQEEPKEEPEEQPEGDNGSENETVNKDELADENETQINPEEEVSLQAASGKFTLGPDAFDISESCTGSGPDGGNYTYDASTNTLTLENYKATGSHYSQTNYDQATSSSFKYYGVYIDSRNIPTLNIVLKGDNYLGDDNNLKYLKTTSDLNTPRTLGIWGNTVKFSGDGTLTIKSHVYPIRSGGIEVAKAKLNMIGYMNGSFTDKMTVYNGAVVNAECKGNNLDFYGLKANTSIIIRNATVSVTSKGCAYTYSYGGLKCPVALYVGGSLSVQDNGALTVTSDGQNGGDGCQGRAVQANTLSLQNGSSLQAYSNGYNTKDKKYDGREAVYISKTIDIDAKSSLYAKTLNTTRDNNDFGNYGAIRMGNGGVWNLENSDGYNNAVITKPVGGTVDSTYNTIRAINSTYAAKEVEILGLGSAVLTLSLDESNNKTWRYRNYSVKNTAAAGIWTYSGDLDLKKGLGSSSYEKIMPRDYEGFYGIDVQDGEHTIVMDDISIYRNHTYITVSNGATLNLKLAKKSYDNYLENTKAGNVIDVEAGGKLNIIGEGIESSSLTILGKIDVSTSSALTVLKKGKVNIKNCVIYGKNYIIGGKKASVSIDKSWIQANFKGDIEITGSNVEGTHTDGNITIDNTSNAALNTNAVLTGNVKNASGAPVYRTTVNFDDTINSSENINKLGFIYRLNREGIVELKKLPVITELRLMYQSKPVILKDLNVLVNGKSITLWLPAGTKIENAYGYNDGLTDRPDLSYVYDTINAVETNTTNLTTVEMKLRNLLLGKGILALRGTVKNNNTQLYADYHDGDTTDWIDYDPTKDIKLQSDAATTTGFGIRVMQNGAAEIKLSALKLIGENKRVTVDSGASLSLQLYEENSLSANGDDAVLNLAGSLTINGADGAKKLTLGGKHAIEGGSSASLTITDSTVINECTDKTTPVKLKSLKISNSNVVGLGLIDCADIVIDGGSVDLDVSEGNVVKDLSGNILTKKSMTFDEKNTKIDKVVIDGLPEGTTFDDSNIITDSSGKVTIWIPKAGKITKVVIGNKTYYPKSDGSMSTSEKPYFTEPSADASYILKSYEEVLFTVAADGSPVPSLQWQKSTDDGKTWNDIEGATSSKYKENNGMSLDLHGTKYRCKATNESGTEYSHTFTVYYEPQNVKIERSSSDRNTFKSGDSIDFTVKLDELKDVVVEQYQWQRSVWIPNKGYSYVDIDGENEMSYHLDITDDTERTYYKCKITLNYPNGDSKNVSSGQNYIQLVKTPVIGEQPCDVAVRTGKAAGFSAKVTGSYQNLTYQWQVSTDGGKNWTNIEGAGGESINKNICYTIPATAIDMNGYQYRCVLNDDFDDVVSKTTVSDPVTLTVLEKRKNDLNVTMQSWTYGDAASVPQYDIPEGITSEVTYTSKAGDELGSSAPANVGDYTVTVKYETDDDIYKGIQDFTISPKTLTPDMIADIPDQIYTGSALIPDIRLIHGTAVTEAGRDYTVEYDNNINSGKATVTITGKGNYQGTVSKEFNIKKAALAITGTAAADAVYGTSLKDIEISGLTVKLGNNEVTGKWSFSGSDILPAGNTTEYAAKFTPESNSENYEDLTLDIAPNISKKIINVNAENKVSRAGNELEKLTYSFEPALIGSDTFTGELATNADRNVVGTYDITRGTLALNDSYDIKFNTGTYTVIRSSSSSYSISVENADNGTVTVDRNSASRGSTVSVAATAADGYRLASVTVTDSSNKEVTLTDKGNGKYTFTMPALAVKIKAAFVKESDDYENPFEDVKESDYFYNPVINANKNGIAKGVDKTHYGPYISCTRAQAVTLMWRAAGSPSPESVTMPFTDVPVGSYYDAVLWAVENDITTGATDSKFNPDGKCTRAQIMTLLWRFKNASAVDAANPFTDVSKDAYYFDAVLWAVKENITKGTSDTAFSPDADCTRAQIVTFLDRCAK